MLKRPKEDELINNLNNPELLHENLITLSEILLNYYNWDFGEDKESIIQDAAVFGLIKARKFDQARRFNPKCGKAFSFFTTCLSCYLRQIERSRKHKKQSKDIV